MIIINHAIQTLKLPNVLLTNVLWHPQWSILIWLRPEDLVINIEHNRLSLRSRIRNNIKYLNFLLGL